MVAAAGWEWQKEETAKALARLAVDESDGIGVYEDKLAKIQSKTRGIQVALHMQCRNSSQHALFSVRYSLLAHLLIKVRLE